jgi:NitT/TauT family transport system substrate-binding protein
VANDKLVFDHVPDSEVRRGGTWDRREFVKGVAALAGSAGLLGYDMKPASAEPPPETTKIRLVVNGAICLAPQYMAEELLRLEGFSHVEYVPHGEGESDPHMAVAAGRADLTMEGATALVPALDRGRPIVVLAGVHGGCYELFGNERVRAVRDLKAKSVAVWGIGSADHVYIASMMAYVGMDPRKDVKWVESPTFEGPMQLFIDGKVDAFLGFPPLPQKVRAKKIGHVIVNTAEDRPWSQHFCCMVSGNREFVRKNPVASKRVVRAILKSADVCAQDPERAARYMVKKGYEANYDIALEVVKEVSYNAWRTFEPEDTLRFHALRLHEVGMIKSDPNKLIAQGTDWRFLNELKRELKA